MNLFLPWLGRDSSIWHEVATQYVSLPTPSHYILLRHCSCKECSQLWIHSPFTSIFFPMPKAAQMTWASRKGEGGRKQAFSVYQPHRCKRIDIGKTMREASGLAEDSFTIVNKNRRISLWKTWAKPLYKYIALHHILYFTYIYLFI